MSSQPFTNFYTPSEAAASSSLSALDVFPGTRCNSLDATHSRHSRKRSYNIENVHRDHYASAAGAKRDRRKTIDCGLAQSPLTPRNHAAQRVARILPQRIITPRSITGVQSIWFLSENEHPDFGVSLADIVDHRADRFMVAPEEGVFRNLGLDNEIQFYILWPGYGHISWIASIPINVCKGRGHEYRPMTRRLLALAVAHHFQAFMTNYSYLRFPHPDPSWKIMNDRENGIRFESLRLTRLFSHEDETGRLSSWQAEILVVDDSFTYTHECIL